MINVVSVKGPESCRGRLGLREETGGVSYEPPGTWWAWVVVTPCAKIPASTRESVDAGVLKPEGERVHP